MSALRDWDIGAAGAVVDRGRVLMARHTYGDKTGLWALPGGFARHDERLDQTAVREVREETGVRATVVDVIGVRTRYTERGGAVFILFRMLPLSGEPVPDGVEIDQVKWFSAQDLLRINSTELLSLSRNAALAALNGGEGLLEDTRFPKRDDAYRAFLVRFEPSPSDPPNGA